MATHLTGVPADLAQRIAELASDLTQYLSDAREEFDGKSERWRDGDTGIAVDGWLDEVGEIADALEDFVNSPTG